MLSKEAQHKAGIRPQTAAARLIVRGLLRFVNPRVTVRGGENLHQISSGTSSVVLPSHRSNADGAILNQVLDEHGVTGTVFVAGQKVGGHPLLGPFVQAVATIPVYSSTHHAHSLREEEKRRAMNHRAPEIVNAALQGGLSVVIFPEGTRTTRPDGGLQRGDRRIVERYLDHVDDTIMVVPVAIEGTEKVLPARRGIRSIIPRRRQPVTISFGQPRSVRELREEAQRQDPAHWSQVAMDRVMTDIADQLIDQSKRGEYANPIQFANLK